jgi:RNase H-like domain found in reverse transcriptase
VLALPRKGGTYILDTDASAAQLGVQLSQLQEDGKPRPLGFWSRKCSAAEQNYSPTEREALEIVWGVKICRPYLERTRFVVRTDHQALRWLFSTTSSDGNPRIVRWKLALSAFDFTVEYRPGSSHKVADELSRMNTDGLSPTPADGDESDFIPCLVVEAVDTDLPPAPVFPRAVPLVRVPEPFEAISLAELLEEQASDSWCQDLHRMLEKPSDRTKQAGIMIDEHGVLCCDAVNNSELPRRWVVPA